MSAPLSPCDTGVIRSTRGGVTCRASAQRGVLAAASLGSGMAFLDSATVPVALPAVQAGLGLDGRGAQWVYGAQTLVLAAFLLVGGVLGDRHGRRRVFVAGATVFAAGSLGCALAPGPALLVTARAVQGAGGALLVPAALAILGAAFAGQQQVRAIAAWSALSGTATAGGPVLGGWLAGEVSWRAAFLITPVMAAVAVPLALRHVPESRDPAVHRPDLAGALLVTVGLAGLAHGLIEGSGRGFGRPAVQAALLLGAVALAGFVVAERRGRDPMVPPALLRSRGFGGANVVTLLFTAALSGSLYLVPFLMVQVHGFPTVVAGTVLLPFLAAALLLRRMTGRICARFGPRPPLVVASLAVAAGCLLFALPGTDAASYWTAFLPAMAVQGFGMALIVTPLTTVALGSVGSERVGLASGVNNAVARVAGLLAVAVLGLVVHASFAAALDERVARLGLPAAVRAELAADLGAAAPPPGLNAATAARIERAVDESFVAAFRTAMLVSSGLAVGAALVAALLLGDRRARLLPSHGELRQRGDGVEPAGLRVGLGPAASPPSTSAAPPVENPRTGALAEDVTGCRPAGANPASPASQRLLAVRRPVR
jgi:EmrB/QacA subfamily drug resistance transporter